MNIANMKAAIRPMSTSQAIDLGTMMARYWFVPLWKIWICMALPFFIILFIGSIMVDMLTASSLSFWGGLIFWWLKPLYEKPMFGWLGQALFTDKANTKFFIRQGFSHIKYYAATLLTFKRLSTQRQLILPIVMLEHPDKAQCRQRLNILSMGQGNGLGWHTIVMVHIESIFVIAAIIVISQLVPTAFMKAETLFKYLQYSAAWFEILMAIFYFIAASIVAPFFVAGGFAVYLTKRCLLEGWDVELVFKQLRYRYEQAQSDQITRLKQV